jgi:hypothetical protein
MARTRLQITAQRRNLSRRLPRPARGNGHVQKACRRALWALQTASTSTIIEWAYARELLIVGERRRKDFNLAVRRALESIGAERIGRAATAGRPWIWRGTDSTSATAAGIVVTAIKEDH